MSVNYLKQCSMSNVQRSIKMDSSSVGLRGRVEFSWSEQCLMSSQWGTTDHHHHHVLIIILVVVRHTHKMQLHIKGRKYNFVGLE